LQTLSISSSSTFSVERRREESGVFERALDVP
jgi:hypothetical protein